jgi:hypothetical protein
MESALRIERLRTDFLVPAGCPNPDGLVRNLAADLERHLKDALDQVLAERLRSRPDVWLIPRMDIGLDVGAHWDGDRVARAFAQAIAGALEPSLNGSIDRSRKEALRFPCPAAYLGHFLVELACGRAWDRWYFRRFRGLRPLPVSAALRSALCSPHAPALEAVSGLEEPDRELVISTLSEPDAKRVLAALADTGRRTEPAAALRALREAWQIRPFAARDLQHPARSALRLLLRIGGQSPDQVSPSLAGLSLAFSTLAGTLSKIAATDPLLAAFHSRDGPALVEAAGAGAAEAMQPLLSCPPELVREAVSGLSRIYREAGAASPHPAESRDSMSVGRYTRFGGLLMLLPILAEWPLETTLRALPPLTGTPVPALLRLLVLTLCAGPRGTNEALYDPPLRDLLAVPGHLTGSDIGAWLQSAGTALLTHLRRDIGRQKPHRDDGPLILARSGQTWVLMRGYQGIWLAAWEGGEADPGPALEQWLASGGTLLAPENTMGALGEIAPSLEVMDYRHGLATDPALDAVLARLDRLGEDLDFVTPPPGLTADRGLALSLAVAAQALFRDFARRLPGFAHSGLAYLYENFLDLGARLEVTDDRYLARLGRSRINVILAMTGLARGTHRLAWLDRPIHLYQGD